MDGFLLKFLMDGSFYLAIFMPVLLSVPKVVKAVLGVVPVLWGVWLFVNWRKRSLIETVRDNFFLEVRILIFAELFESLFLGLTVWEEQCAPYITSFLVSGILILRLGRISKGNQERHKFWGANGAEVSLVLLAAALLAWKPVFRTILKIPGAFYNKLVLPVLVWFLKAAVGVFVWLWSYIERFLPELAVRGPQENAVVIGDTSELMFSDNWEAAETPLYFKVLGTMFVAAVLLLFFRYLYHRLSERGQGQGTKAAGELKRSRAGAAVKKTPGKTFFSGERNVRYYYRRFLELCMAHGIGNTDGTDTSEDVRKKAAAAWKMEKELGELRCIYLEIRYGEKKESREEKRRAKELYKAIKEKAEQT